MMRMPEAAAPRADGLIGPPPERPRRHRPGGDEAIDLNSSPELADESAAKLPPAGASKVDRDGRIAEPVPERSPEQVLHERAASEVSGVLLILEDALDRTQEAHEQVRKDGYDSNAELALAEVVKELQRVHKRLERDTIYAGDKLRLI